MDSRVSQLDKSNASFNCIKRSNSTNSLCGNRSVLNCTLPNCSKVQASFEGNLSKRNHPLKVNWSSIDNQLVKRANDRFSEKENQVLANLATSSSSYFVTIDTK